MTLMTNSKRYSDLLSYSTFEDRFNYLKLNSNVGDDTFGFDRYLNQQFYKSREWKSVRDYVITRDNGCDLGIPGMEIQGPIYIHHINPINIEDIEHSSDKLLDPENLICVSFETHNAIHYGDDSFVSRNTVIERSHNDMCPWKK